MNIYIVKIGNQFLYRKWDNTTKLVKDMKHATIYTNINEANNDISYITRVEEKYTKQKKSIIELKTSINNTLDINI